MHPDRRRKIDLDQRCETDDDDAEKQDREDCGTGATAPLTPPIDADKEKEPDHIDEMPVPRGCLETEMVVGFEVSPPCAVEADDQKSRADDDVEPMEAGRHEE